MISNEGEPAEFAASISALSMAVVLLGLDEDRHLIRVSVESGTLRAVVREDAATFSTGDFDSWTAEFPYHYGMASQTANLFYVTTERLRLSDFPEGRVVLVLDTELGQLPPNLIRTGDEFAGENRAMAGIPSLSWLIAARASPRPSSHKLSAWISTTEEQGRTLSMIAERLRDTFVKHAIGLNTEATLPRSMASSDLVVLAAHGSISPEGRYFLRISDEGRLDAPPHEIASSLRNVGIVVLFVCSGGRADKHPAANTTIGLAKELLNSGCSSVVASPWPLDARITYHWLPAFLDALSSGSPVIDANFKANRAVANSFSSDLEHCLAMNVFGDPLSTIS